MEKVYTICNHCSEKHCCRGLCKEMNDYLVERRKKERNQYDTE